MKAARKKSATGRTKGGIAAAPKRRAEPAAAQAGKREAILSAALEEFSTRGFAAGRLDDVARRAGVAKGTIYLYFRDKETLFQERVRAELSPVVAALEAAPIGDLPMRVVAERLVTIFAREIIGTHRKDVIRLVLTRIQFPYRPQTSWQNRQWLDWCFQLEILLPDSNRKDWRSERGPAAG